MMFQAVLSNRDHPEYGVATIPFPIPHDQYTYCMELLEALEMSKYIPFTTEQKERAASVDLEEFLRRRGEKLITSGKDKRLASDHSIHHLRFLLSRCVLFCNRLRLRLSLRQR